MRLCPCSRGPVIMDISGFTEKGFKRKLAVQALFGKILYLSENRLNITKSIRRFSIDPNLKPTGSEFHAGPIPRVQNHGDETEEEYGDGSVTLTSESFDGYSHSLSPVYMSEKDS